VLPNLSGQEHWPYWMEKMDTYDVQFGYSIIINKKDITKTVSVLDGEDGYLRRSIWLFDYYQ
jgi:hypothetical protein